MDVGAEPEPDVGFGVGKLKARVAIASVIAGDKSEEGVEACSVANRFGVGGEEMGRLHPTIKRKRKTVKWDLNLFIIQFD